MNTHIPLAAFGIEQVVRAAEESTLFSLAPDAQGHVVERRYSIEKGMWMYMVSFEFGTFPFPEHELREVERKDSRPCP